MFNWAFSSLPKRWKSQKSEQIVHWGRLPISLIPVGTGENPALHIWVSAYWLYAATKSSARPTNEENFCLPLQLQGWSTEHWRGTHRHQDLDCNSRCVLIYWFFAAKTIYVFISPPVRNLRTLSVMAFTPLIYGKLYYCNSETSCSTDIWGGGLQHKILYWAFVVYTGSNIPWSHWMKKPFVQTLISAQLERVYFLPNL